MPEHNIPRRILLVDDDQAVREFMAFSLRRAGYEVTEAASGEDAFVKFQEMKGVFDLLLTDMVMPGLFGDQLAVRLLELKSGLPIIFLSGNPPASLEPGVVLEEGKNFLRKPFSIADLNNALEAQLCDQRENAEKKVQ